jgi:hypothetical protein
MPITYEPIATTTLGSDTNQVDFNSISGSYTDIIVVANCYTTDASLQYMLLRFNSDSGSNYSRTELYGNGSSAASIRGTNESSIVCGDVPINANKYGINILHINNYSNSTTYKTVLARGNAATNLVEAFVGLWRNTNAITSMSIICQNSKNFGSGSTFTLYGIKAA